MNSIVQENVNSVDETRVIPYTMGQGKVTRRVSYRKALRKRRAEKGLPPPLSTITKGSNFEQLRKENKGLFSFLAEFPSSEDEEIAKLKAEILRREVLDVARASQTSAVYARDLIKLSGNRPVTLPNTEMSRLSFLQAATMTDKVYERRKGVTVIPLTEEMIAEYWRLNGRRSPEGHFRRKTLDHRLDPTVTWNSLNDPQLRIFKPMFRMAIEKNLTWDGLLGAESWSELARTFPRQRIPMVRAMLESSHHERRALEHVVRMERRYKPQGNTPSQATVASTLNSISRASESIDESATQIAGFFSMLNTMARIAKVNIEKLACFETIGFVQLFLAKTSMELASAFLILSKHPLFEGKIPPHFMELVYTSVLTVENVWTRFKPEANFVHPERNNIFARFQNSPLVQKAGLLTAAMSASLFVNSFPLAIRTMLNEFNTGTRTIDQFVTVTEAAVDFLSYFWERIQRAWETGDPMELLGRNLEKELCEKMSNWILEMQKYRLKPAGRTPQDMIEAGKDLLKRSGAFDTRDILHLSYRSKIDAAVRSLELAQHDRIKPALGLFLVGASGAGKTHTLIEIEAFMRTLQNLPDDTPIRMEYQDIKHQHIPTLPLIVSYNDAFQLKDEHTNVSTLGLLQSMVDTVVPRFETASLEEKANSYVAPVVVAFSTNTMRYHMSKATTGANKLNRRYRIVHYEYTEKAHLMAEENCIDIGTLLKAFPNEPDLVKYTYGFPAFKEAAVLDFALMAHKKETTDFCEVLQYIVDAIKARDDEKEVKAMTKLVDGKVVRLPTEGGTPRPAKIDTVSNVTPAEPSEQTSNLSPEGAQTSTLNSSLDLEEEEDFPEVPGTDFRVVNGSWVRTPFWIGDRVALPKGFSPHLSYQLTHGGEMGKLWDLAEGPCALRYKGIRQNESVLITSVHYGAFHDPDSKVWRTRVMEGAEQSLESLEELTGLPLKRVGMKKVTIDGATFPAWLVAAVGATACVSATLLVGIIRAFKRRFVEATLAPGLVNVPNEDPAVVPKTPGLELMWAGASLNKYVAQIRRSDGTCSMNAVVITGDVVATAGHFFNGYTGFFTPMKEGEKFQIKLGTEWQTFSYVKKTVISRSEDLAFVRLPNLTCVASVAYGALPQESLTTWSEGTFKGQVIKTNGRLSNANSGPGDCGIPYHVGGLIVGLHVGALGEGSSRQTVLEPLSRSIVDSVRKEFEERNLPAPVYAEGVPEKMNEFLKNLTPGIHKKSGAAWLGERMEKTDHLVVGSLSFPEIPKMSGKKSPAYDYLSGHIKEYATPHTRAQSSSGYVCPLTVRVDAMEAKTNIDEECWAAALDSWLEHAPVPQEKLSPLNLHQVLAGDPDSHLIKPRDLTKAVGPTLLKGCKLSKEKAFVFDETTGKYEVAPDVLEEFHRLESILEEGKVPITFATATLKDELLPKEKVDAGKGRYFFVCDLAANMLMRKYILPLMVALLNEPLISEVIGTINPGSEQWDQLMRHMIKFGRDRLVDSDQKGFDSHHDRALRDYAMLMSRYSLKCGYSKKDALMVYLVLRMMGRYALFMEGVLYICSKGLTSGRADTLVANSVINKVLMYYCYHRACEEDGVPLTARLSVIDMMVMACTGDDNMTGLHPHCPLKPSDITRFQAEAGYEVTDASKKGVPFFKDISEVSFLKRRFVERDGRVLAPLELSSILKSVAYQTGKFKDRDAEIRRVGEACQSAIRELFLHDIDVEANYRSILEKIVEDFALPKLPTREQLENDYVANVFTPWSVQSYELRCTPTTDPCEDGSLNIVALGTLIAPGSLAYTPEGSRTVTLPLRSGEPRGAPSGISSANKLEQGIGHAETTALSLNETGIATGEPTTQNIIEHNVGDLSTLELGRSAPSAVHIGQELTFARLLSRDRLLYRILAGTTTLNPINSEFFYNSQVASVTRPYRCYRGDFVITIVVTGSSAVIGRDRFAFLPQPGDDNYRYTIGSNATVDSLVSASIPHVDVDYSQPGSYEITLPYASSLPMLRKNDNNWFLKTMNLAPLISAYGLTPPALNVAIYARLENPEFFIPIIPEGAADAVPQGPLSKMLGMGSRIAAMAPIPYADMISKAMGFGSKVAEMLGYSRPPVTPGTIVVARRNADMSLMSGQPDFSHCLGSIPGQGRNVEVTAYPMASDKDDDLKEICKIRSIVRFELGQNEYFPVDPSIVRIFTGSGPIEAGPLAHASMAFKYWRGSMKVCLTFASSPLIRMRIGVNVFPPGQLGASFVSDGTIQAYTLDVIGTSCVEVEVPWLYEAFWMPVSPYRANNNTLNFLPRIKWFILEGPIGPSDTPVYSKPVVEVWAGDDFELAVPTTEHIALYTAKPPPAGFVTPEGLAEAFFGETVPNVRYLGKRSSAVTLSTTLDVIPADGIYPLAIGEHFTFDTWFRRCFMGYTGSTVHKIVPVAGTSRFEAIETMSHALDFMGGSGAAAVDPSHVDFVDLRCVDRCTTLFKNPRFDAGNADRNCQSLFFNEPPTGGWWMASGDDRLYINYLGPAFVWLK